MANFLKCLVHLSIFAQICSSGNIVCYFTSWTIYRLNKGLFNSSFVDPHLCTHIMYAFIGLNEDRSGKLFIMDKWEAIKEGGYGYNEIANLVALKRVNPGLKVLVSMGGWNECESDKYSVVAADSRKRRVFVDDVVDFLDEHRLDGFDLDWEYPCQRSGKPWDKWNFIRLLRELRAALHPRGYLLAAAVGAGLATTDTSYHVKAVSDTLDIINLMTYDYHGSFESFVGHHSPLYASRLDQTVAQKAANANASVNHWIARGADPRKIHLGIATYGRSFTLSNSKYMSLYAKTIGAGNSMKITNQDGVLGYNEICLFCGKWRTFRNLKQRVPHKVFGNQWVGYEDKDSVCEKAKYVVNKKLGGVMVWSLDTDDFGGHCSGEKYPLLKTINNVFKSSKLFSQTELISCFSPMYAFA